MTSHRNCLVAISHTTSQSRKKSTKKFRLERNQEAIGLSLKEEGKAASLSSTGVLCFGFSYDQEGKQETEKRVKDCCYYQKPEIRTGSQSDSNTHFQSKWKKF